MSVTLKIDRATAHRRAFRATAAAFRSRVRPRPRLTLSEWADRYRVISDGTSAQPGAWRTDLVPYTRGIMDEVSGREYTDFTIVKCSQSGGTEILNNAVGYYIDQEPSPMLMIQPNVKPMAEAWSKERLAPMLRDCVRLRDKVKDPRARDSGNTVALKMYPGGYIAIVGANSPAGLASRPIRIVLADELDRWTDSAGTEGDPLALAAARMTTFRERKKMVKVSSPGNEGESRIEKEWDLSDQRHFYVPCPHCGEMQPLEWRDTEGKPDVRMGKGAYRLVWDKVERDGKVVHLPETAGYMCRACAVVISETYKAGMLAKGVWVKHNPESKRAGWHIPGLISPWIRWTELAQWWLDVRHDAEQRKTFINTRLGLLYAEAGDVADPSKMTRQKWGDDEPLTGWVPKDAGWLSAAVDVQGDRMEVLVVGWGEGEECWLVHHEKVFGADASNNADVWGRVDAILAAKWTHEGGAPMYIQRLGIDAGAYTADVLAWVRPREARGIWALKGSDDLTVPIQRAERKGRDKVKIFSFNPTMMKDVLFPRLRKLAYGPGAIHIGIEERTGVGDDFLTQYSAEKRVVERNKNGRMKPIYKVLAGKRNEAIDLSVMNLVVFRAMGETFGKTIGKLVQKVQGDGAQLAREVGAPKQPETPRRRGTGGSGWKIGGWK